MRYDVVAKLGWAFLKERRLLSAFKSDTGIKTVKEFEKNFWDRSWLHQNPDKFIDILASWRNTGKYTEFQAAHHFFRDNFAKLYREAIEKRLSKAREDV